MAAPNRNNQPITNQTEQYVLNYSFDEVFKILMVGLAAYNPTTNSYDRVQINADGTLSTAGGSSATTYSTRLDDYTTPSVSYIGKAVPGTATSAANWQIAKMDETTGTVITYAGTGSFNQVWDNRTGLTYS